MVRGERRGATVVAQVRISRGKGALLWGCKYTNIGANVRKCVGEGALRWGVGVVRGERGGAMVGAQDTNAGARVR